MAYAYIWYKNSNNKQVKAIPNFSLAFSIDKLDWAYGHVYLKNILENKPRQEKNTFKNQILLRIVGE